MLMLHQITGNGIMGRNNIVNIPLLQNLQETLPKLFVLDHVMGGYTQPLLREIELCVLFPHGDSKNFKAGIIL